MEAMATRPGATVEASFSAGTAYFVAPAHPAELNFKGWLEARTPPGAPTLEVLPPGTGVRVRLPQLRPPALPQAHRRGRRHRGLALAFHAAYMHDVGALGPRRLIASGLFDFTTDRAARHHVRDGRLTAAALGVWPWAVTDGQPLPRNWWADRHFALALQQWAVGELHPLAVGGAAQTQRPRRYTAAARLPIA
jgi:hypothetical protein